MGRSWDVAASVQDLRRFVPRPDEFEVRLLTGEFRRSPHSGLDHCLRDVQTTFGKPGGGFRGKLDAHQRFFPVSTRLPEHELTPGKLDEFQNDCQRYPLYQWSVPAV